MARGRGGRAREGASRRHGRGERERECGVPVGRRCSLERNYPPRDRDEAAVTPRGGERRSARGRERKRKGEGKGGRRSIHAARLLARRCAVPCRCCSFFSSRAPVPGSSPFFNRWPNRACPAATKRARLAPYPVRIIFFFFFFLFPPSLPIASRDTCRRCRYLVRVETIEQQRRVRSELSSDCHEEEVGVGSVWRD